MKLKKRLSSKMGLFRDVFSTSVWIILVFGIFGFFVQIGGGIQKLSASTHYGIEGRRAPEIHLNSWIDGNGRSIEPIRLSEYRGKVVYLYFFQDW
jgi:hypothetical protein